VIASVSASMQVPANIYVRRHPHLGVPCLFVYSSNDPAIAIRTRKDRFFSKPYAQVNLNATGHFPIDDNPTNSNRLMTVFLHLTQAQVRVSYN